MTEDYRDRSNKAYRERQRGKISTLTTQVNELVVICGDQQDEIEALKRDVAGLKHDVLVLKAHAANYDALDQENRRLAALVETLKAQLGDR